MEVVNENFYLLLPEIEKAIEDCTFIAIDGEFTGLHNGTMVSVFDTAAQYYEKLRSNCMDFLMIQFGLCAVKYDAEKKKFTYRAYNFYTFPKPMSRYAPDCRFLCQSSSMEFLSNHDFDFNKLFKHGIPFLTLPDEELLHNELLNRYKQNCLQASQTVPRVSDIIPIPDVHKAEVEAACDKVKELLENDKCSEVIIAEKSNSFVRKLIYQEVYRRFSDTKLCLQSKMKEDFGNVMIAYKGRSKELMAKERMEREKIELEKAVGFSAVLKKISKCNKPVIGHNMTLDICHMVHQFCLPLPSSYKDFQNTVKYMSTRFFDTKYISGTEPLKNFFGSTVLNDLNKLLLEQDRNYSVLEPETPEVGFLNDTLKLHDAGFDAYLTATVFVNLCNLYGNVRGIKEQMFPDLSHLKKYQNKLFMTRYNEDPCLDLSGPEPPLQRSHVYHITFPAEWKTIDITNIFNPLTEVFIKYINDISAWVALKDASQAKAMNKVLPKLQGAHKNIKITPWSEYYKELSIISKVLKRKIDDCSPSPTIDNMDSSTVKDKCTEESGETPEKLPRLSKSRRVSKGGNISPILEGDESIELDVDSSTVSNNSVNDSKNDSGATSSYNEKLKLKKSTETAELKTIFPVASWD